MATDAVRSRRASERSGGSGVIARLTPETKHSLKTTELWAMLAIIAGILIASAIVGQGDSNGNDNVDAFPASRAWLYIAIVGYMVTRGLARPVAASRTGQTKTTCPARAAATTDPSPIGNEAASSKKPKEAASAYAAAVASAAPLPQPMLVRSGGLPTRGDWAFETSRPSRLPALRDRAGGRAQAEPP